MLAEVAIIFWASVFSLGGKEQQELMLKENFWEVYLYRLSFCLILGLLVFLISKVLDFFFKNSAFYDKTKIKRINRLEFLFIIILSVLFTTWALATQI
ncbi:MAG: hypothetical protein V4538_12250 [Bacteroidota bacterium]